jgi:hypothetical protein
VEIIMSSSSSSSIITSTMLCNKSLERKVRKPKIEKLRRARINTSLEQLKEILLRNTISIPQGSRPTKLEKADILEMSVRYIEMLHEKLSVENEKSSPSSLVDNSLIADARNANGIRRIRVKCHDREALNDVTNQINILHERKIHHAQNINDNKSSASSSLWLYNRFNIHQWNYSSSNNNNNNNNNNKNNDNTSDGNNNNISSISNENLHNKFDDKENIQHLHKRVRQFNEKFSSISSTQQSIFSSSSDEHHWRPW